MSRITRTLLLCLVITSLGAGACNQMPAPFAVEDRSPRAARDAPFDPPPTYPGWAYDAPGHLRPEKAVQPQPRAKTGDPLHYFTNEKLIMVRRPGGYAPGETPRVALWWTDNNGYNWQMAGYFGRHQKFFPFEVEEDGTYGIRFVGPGQAPATHTPANPTRVLHVDTRMPNIELSIEPEQTWYRVGQEVTVSWHAEDANLDDDPTTIRMLLDFTADEPRTIELQRELARQGSFTFEVPPEALEHGIQIRAEAQDRAGNLGLAYSHTLQIVPESIADTNPVDDTFADAGPAARPAPDVSEREEPVIDVSHIHLPVSRTKPIEIARLATGETATPTAVSDEEAARPGAWDAPDSAPAYPGQTQHSETGAGERSAVTDPTRDTPTPKTGPGRNESVEMGAMNISADAAAPTNRWNDEPQAAAEAIGVEPAATDPAVVTPTGFEGAGMISPQDPPSPTTPFPSAPARQPLDDGHLRWEGSTPAVFPNGRDAPARRAPGGLFDPNSPAPPEHADDPQEETTVGASRSQGSESTGRADGAPADRAPLTDTGAPALGPSDDGAVGEGGSEKTTHPLPALINDALSVIIDPTDGNGLMIPLPATIETWPSTDRLATAHPWRLLGSVCTAPLPAVWLLPRVRLGYQPDRILPGGHLAGIHALRPVAEPGAVYRAVAGLPAEIVATDPTILP